MLELQRVIDVIKSGERAEYRKANAFMDARDLLRLLDFVPLDQWDALGFTRRLGPRRTCGHNLGRT